MDARPSRDEELSRLFEVHYPDTVRLAFYLTGSWAVGEELGPGGVRAAVAALGSAA